MGCIPLLDSTSENSRAPYRFALSAIPTAGILYSKHLSAKAFGKIAPSRREYIVFVLR